MRTFILAIGDVITYNYYDEIRTNTICGANSEEFLVDESASGFKTVHRNWTKNIIEINDNIVDKEDVVLCSNLTPDFDIMSPESFQELELIDGTIIDSFFLKYSGTHAFGFYDSGEYEHNEDDEEVDYDEFEFKDIVSINGVKVTKPLKANLTALSLTYY